MSFCSGISCDIICSTYTYKPLQDILNVWLSFYRLRPFLMFFSGTPGFVALQSAQRNVCNIQENIKLLLTNALICCNSLFLLCWLKHDNHGSYNVHRLYVHKPAASFLLCPALLGEHLLNMLCFLNSLIYILLKIFQIKRDISKNLIGWFYFMRFSSVK